MKNLLKVKISFLIMAIFSKHTYGGDESAKIKTLEQLQNLLSKPILINQADLKRAKEAADKLHADRRSKQIPYYSDLEMNFWQTMFGRKYEAIKGAQEVILELDNQFKNDLPMDYVSSIMREVPPKPRRQRSNSEVLVFHYTNSKKDALAILSEGLKSRVLLAQEGKAEVPQYHPLPGHYELVYFQYNDPKNMHKDSEQPGLWWYGDSPAVALKVNPHEVNVYNREFRMHNDISPNNSYGDSGPSLCRYNASGMRLAEYIKKRKVAAKLGKQTGSVVVFHPISALPEIVDENNWKTKNSLWFYFNEVTFNDSIPANRLAK